MKVYNDTQASQRLSELLNEAQTEEVLIRRKDGVVFSIVPKPSSKSPFAVKGIKTACSTQDILDALKESRTSN
ncbi:MAG: prevent-host-death protein [Proteobacteria bacterium]|nr:prevent-host-death protein [Pseudomonadota bacterium]